MAKQVVILTVGRSGSSMLANVLVELGIYMGTSFKPADENNELGYWEDPAFGWVNRRLISEWYAPIPEFWDIDSRLSKTMRRLVQVRNQQHQIWGWKDPRTLHTIGHWKPLLDNPRFICLWRDDEAVIASYVKYWGEREDVVRSIVLRGRNRLSQFEADHECLSLQYEKLLADRNVKEIADFVGVPYQEQVRDIIRPELNRQGG